MIPHLAIELFSWSVVAIMAVLILGMIRRSLITNSVTISKETDHGEGVSLTVNFYAFESKAAKFRKLQELAYVGEERRKHVDKQYKAAVAAAQAHQASADGKLVRAK